MRRKRIDQRKTRKSLKNPTACSVNAHALARKFGHEKTAKNPLKLRENSINPLKRCGNNDILSGTSTSNQTC